MLALVGGLVAALLLIGRNAVDTAMLASSELAQDAAIQSALNLAAYQLVVLGNPASGVDGQQIRLDQGVVTLRVSPEAGKVDLNGSGKILLAAAYRAAGLTAMTPDTFAARVIDWRDADDDAEKEGAEAADYAAAGLSHTPRNADFRSIDDLRWLMGMRPGDLAALSGYLTVFNPAGRLSAYAAPRELIAAIPGIAGETVDEVVSARSRPGAATTELIADRLLVQSALIDTSPNRSYRIGMEFAGGTARTNRRSTAVIAAGATPAQPFQILDWVETSP
ncbi:type II secretion system minor pseudopilin [Ensifer soli]|uniref:general secretion pathway protein GspK n=1 Tax=Ciceribacter sp. sgz301302 TaxID=3342379 RepID=UPI0035B9D23B